MSFENMLAANADMAPPAAEGRWSRLRRRIVSAAVVAPPALAAAYAGAPYFNLLVAVAAGILVWEACRASGIDSPMGDRFAMPSVALVLGGAALALWSWTLLAFAAIAIVGMWRSLARGRGRESWGWGAILYIGAASLAALWLRADEAVGRAIVLWIVAVVIASDIGAYAVGRLVGGPKLAPRLSPGKTWAGAVGGLVAGALAGAMMPFAATLGGGIAAVLASLGLALVAEAGDLLESAFKRRFGVKDTGRLIPGHGGLADRLDSVMGAVLAVAVVRLLLDWGVVAWL